MNKTKRMSFFAFLMFLLIATSIAAPAENLFRVKNRKITGIVSPTLGVPAIVTTGAEMKLVVSTDFIKEIQEVRIEPIEGGSKLILTARMLKKNGAPNEYVLEIPADAAPGLYNLQVENSAGVEFIQYHSVKIIEKFKKNFHFTVISDIHFGDTRGELQAPGADFDSLRRNALIEASRSHPEFVLFTGDVTSMPQTYERDYGQAWNYFIEYCDAPVFMVPGNHDEYIIPRGTSSFVDGKLYWEATFGRPYYYFDYGRIRFVGLDNYEWPSKLRSSATLGLITKAGSVNKGNMGSGQFKWLGRTLEPAGDREIIVFTHLPIDEMKGGQEAIGGEFTIPGIPATDVIGLLERYGVKYVFIGHWHRNEVKDLGGIKQVMTNTCGSVLYDETQPWGFNTVFVKDWKISRIEYTELKFE